eukprot:TRINITY_DN5350_c0_g1_i1.p1 TRINITY_DN5350_c0_g1~~TRINITY_DN5350_c0_g1_i1.p1  ORF type:complete len:144 (+),score=14.83 TRINITY_DN5350_c0_g1_i1:82-513(+)
MVTFRGRYLLAKIHWKDGLIDTSMRASHIHDAISRSLKMHFGAYGESFSASISVKYWNYETNNVIVRAPFNIYKMAWASITLITSIEDRESFFEVLHLGGTMKSCKKMGIKIEDKYEILEGSEDEQPSDKDQTEQQSETTMNE